MAANGNMHFSEGARDDCVCAFTMYLCISDWSGNWSDPVHSRYRNLSNVLIPVRSGEMFRSTSSTDTTTHREKERGGGIIIRIQNHARMVASACGPFTWKQFLNF